MAKKIVIVGGVAGGASAAARIRRLDETAHIVLLERGPYISFANCGLPYYVGGAIQDRGSLLVQTPEAMRRRFQIDVRVGSEAVEIDVPGKEVLVRDRATGALAREGFDALILATGSSPVIPDIPGVEAEHVFTVWDVPDTDRIKAFVADQKPRRAVVVGGGFVGLEMAENLKALGLDVALVEMADQVMAPLDWDMAQYLHKELCQQHVELYLREKVTAFQQDGAQTLVSLSGGRVLPADLVVIAAGIHPNSELARGAGLKLGQRGHIATDARMRTSTPDIYAVGDVAEVADRMTGTPTAIPLAGPANKQGRIAADCLCGLESRYPGTLKTSVAKVFGLTAASTGRSEKDLLRDGKRPGHDFVTLYSHPFSHASYYPDSTQLHMKLTFDPKDGRVLGAQAIGDEGAAKRVDVIAACIHFGGTTADLTELELAYAPPYNTAKDPVNFLGYMGENLRGGLVDLIQWHELGDLDPARTQIVDVRTAKEHAQGAIPGSILVPVDQLRESLDRLDREKIQILYCRVGIRSYLAARILAQHGFRAKSINGGWLTWSAAAFQISEQR